MFKKNCLTVKEVNHYIKNLLDGDSLLSNLWVKGEISNFKAHSSGHLYFTLKDETSTLKCVMFKSYAQRLKFRPVHGMQILAMGYVSIYQRDGQYQLYVQEMHPAGAGALHIAYEQLKERLTKEGLFDKSKKRPLPFFPSTIGVITSLTGAALKDILSILKRRSPQTKIIIVPAMVQGEEASQSICNALDKMYNQEVDVIIIGRGGGSLEELWCFNDENVIRKISLSPVPVISAVGHETDFTLTDFVADCRAATPSMAAEIVVPIKEELILNIMNYRKRLFNAIKKQISQERQRVSYLAKSQIMRDPVKILNRFQQDIDYLNLKLMTECKQKFKEEQGKLGILSNKLDALSPLKTMTRGFSITYNKSGEIIKSIKQVENEELIQVSIYDGNLSCLVKGKEEGKHGRKVEL